MCRHLNWTVRVFQLSLAVLLVAGAGLGLTIRYGWTDWSGFCNVAVLTAALCAGASRVVQWRMRHGLREVDFSAGAGYYRLEHMR
jgi:hypothetical protein